MDTQGAITLTLQIESDPAASPERLADLTRQFRRELKEAGFQQVDFAAAGPAPPGTKTLEMEAAILGALVGAFAQSVLPILIEFIQDWLKRHRRERFTLNCGKGTIQVTAEELTADIIARINQVCSEPSEA